MRYKKMKDESYMDFLIDGVIGTRDYLERMLTTKGFSSVSTKEFIDKIEVIIALSGKLGRLVQREKDLQELHKMKMELITYKREAGIY